MDDQTTADPGDAEPHGEALWRGEFPLMVAWAFGR
jgi:hypothetical protein